MPRIRAKNGGSFLAPAFLCENLKIDKISPVQNEFWSQLTKNDKKLLLPVLLRQSLSDEFHLEHETLAHAELMRLIYYPDNRGTDEEKLLTIQNLVQQLGAIPDAWSQMREIIGVAVGYLEIRVHDRDEFLRALKAERFAINSWMEKVGKFFGHGHRFDSARALTRHRHEPQLHFVNDRADESDYGPNYFFVHWDAQSVHASHSSLLSKIPAGLTHRHMMASPHEVAAYLEKMRER